MRTRDVSMGLGRLCLPALAAALVTAPLAAQSAPEYSARAVGEGFPVALNESGQIVGWRTEAGSQRAWISTGDRSAAGAQLLPLPAGMRSSYANDISDSGVVVGKACREPTCEIGSPVLWTSGEDGYEASVIETFLGEAHGELTGINNRGDLIGVAGAGFHTPFVITDEGGIRDLGLVGFFSKPAAINDARQIVGGTTNQRLNLETGIIDYLGVPSAPGQTYLWTVPFDINEAGQVTGYGQLKTELAQDQAVVRYTDDIGWEVLGVPGAFNTGYGINDSGVVRAEMFRCGDVQPTLHRDGSEGACLEELLADEGWFFLSSFSGDVNNAGQMIAWGGNTATGEGGAILLTPVAAAALSPARASR